MTIREMLYDCSRRSGSEIRNLAVNSCNDLITYLENHNVSSDGVVACITDLFKLFVSADRKTRDGEYALFLLLTGLNQNNFSSDDFYNATNGGASFDFVSKMKSFIKSLPDDIRFAVGYLGVAIFSADRHIDENEISLLEDLIS